MLERPDNEAHYQLTAGAASAPLRVGGSPQKESPGGKTTGARLTRHRSREPGYTLREGSVERFYALGN
jgi:hypothetical protein